MPCFYRVRACRVLGPSRSISLSGGSLIASIVALFALLVEAAVVALL